MSTTSESPRVVVARTWLIGGGVVIVLGGLLVFLRDVRVEQYPGVLLWIAGAIILHDGIAALAVFGATVLLRRLSPPIPFVVIAIAQGAAVVWLIVSVLILPELVKKAIGSANPTILPLDYLGSWSVFSAGLAALTVLAIIVSLIIRARRRSRPRTR